MLRITGERTIPLLLPRKRRIVCFFIASTHSSICLEQIYVLRNPSRSSTYPYAIPCYPVAWYLETCSRGNNRYNFPICWKKLSLSNESGIFDHEPNISRSQNVHVTRKKKKKIRACCKLFLRLRVNMQFFFVLLSFFFFFFQ